MAKLLYGNGRYGYIGCQDFKGGIQDLKVFWLQVSVPKGNHLSFRNGVVGRCKKVPKFDCRIRIFLSFFLFKNINLILHPSLENSTTLITIMEMEEHIDQLTCNAHSWAYALIKIIVKGQILSLALQSFFLLLLDQIWSILQYHRIEFVMYYKDSYWSTSLCTIRGRP